MPEWLGWLGEQFNRDEGIHLDMLVARMAAAFALGCVVAGIYRLTHRKPHDSRTNLMPMLVLLTVLIAMVTLVIGNSVARAFSLVGALAIVRFRTLVEDTRDTAFVIFAVAVGMAFGAGYLKIPLVGIAFAGAAAVIFRPRDRSAAGAGEMTLLVRVGTGRDPDALLREAFGRHLLRHRLVATTTARQGAALDLTYAVRLRRGEAAVPLVAQLNALDGVQSVELR
jgi:uncharacterized membrane protein YhiD involved in acid resistance